MRADVLGGLESIKQQIVEYSNDPTIWGDREQQLAAALEIFRAIDTAHSRGIGLLDSQPLEAQISSIMTAEFQALIDSMGRETTHEMARKLTVGLILGDSVGSIRRDLLDAQNEDGSWGIEPGRAGNPLDTAVAITALLGVRPIQVPHDACLAAAEYLLSAKAENSSNPNNGPFWPLSGETYGESHLEYAATGLKAIRLIEARISNNTTRTLRDNARSYVGTGADQSAFDDNNVEENALVLWSIHGLLMWNGSSWPVDAILDIDNTGIKNVSDIPGQPRTVSWDNESGDEDVYTTALAVNALAYWLPELEIGQPDLTSLPGDLLLDPTTNEIVAVYRNQGESPAISYADSGSSGTLEPTSFLVGKARIELPVTGTADELTQSTLYFQEQSTLQSATSQSLDIVGPGTDPIPVTLILDPNGVISETNESNNRVTLAIDRNDMGLDVSVTPEDIRFEEDSGDWTVLTTVRAVGRDIDSNEPLTVSLTSSTDGNNYSAVQAAPQTPFVSARSAEFAWILDDAPTQDTHFKVVVSADDECVTCDTNNEAIALAIVSAVNDGDNISISVMDDVSVNFAPGSDLLLDVEGNWDSNIQSSALDTTLTIRAGGQNLASKPISLAATGSWTESFTILASQLTDIPIRIGTNGDPVRRLELTAVIDPLNLVPENDESDNSMDLLIQMDYPDLIIDEGSISVSRLDLASDPETIVSVGLRNEGTQPLDFSQFQTVIVFEFSPDGLDYDVFSTQEIENGQLGFGEGLHFSAPLIPPVGDVHIRARLEFATAPIELSVANNTATKVFTFTRQTLTIELRPEVASDQYSAGEPSVRSHDGVIVDLFHQPPPQDPIDPYDDVSVTYSAQFGPLDGGPDELYDLSRSGGQPASFRIPIEVFETWTPGQYVIYANGYEDDRLASSSTKAFDILPYSGQGLAASTLPADGDGISTNQPARELSFVNGSYEPALFITINSVSNITRTLKYEAVLEQHNQLIDEYASLPGVDNTLSQNIISGELTNIQPGSINIREDIIIPDAGAFAVLLTEPGLYRFKVRLLDQNDVELRIDDAPFRVDQPSEYVLLEKVFKIDGDVVNALRPIEGQEVDVELIVKRSSN